MATEFGPIQIIPAGLLGFFQLKQEGRNPNTFSSMVQGTLDLFELYRAYKREVRSTAQILVGVGLNTWSTFTNGESAQVPANEWWFVDHFVVASTALGASENVQMAPTITVLRDGDGQASSTLGVGPPVLTSSVAGETTATAYCQAERPYIMCPGDRFSAFVLRENSVAGVSIAAECGFIRMRA